MRTTRGTGSIGGRGVRQAALGQGNRRGWGPDAWLAEGGSGIRREGRGRGGGSGGECGKTPGPRHSPKRNRREGEEGGGGAASPLPCHVLTPDRRRYWHPAWNRRAAHCTDWAEGGKHSRSQGTEEGGGDVAVAEAGLGWAPRHRDNQPARHRVLAPGAPHPPTAPPAAPPIKPMATMVQRKVRGSGPTVKDISVEATAMSRSVGPRPGVGRVRRGLQSAPYPVGI